jgi:hypothetical protein
MTILLAADSAAAGIDDVPPGPVQASVREALAALRNTPAQP